MVNCNNDEETETNIFKFSRKSVHHCRRVLDLQHDQSSLYHPPWTILRRRE
jgi:hypothetical protein